MNSTAKLEINENQQLLRQTVIGASATLFVVVALIALANFIV